MKKRFEILYGILAIIVLIVATVGATYAYWVASANSSGNSVQTGSTIYNISMSILPLYSDFSFIPMNDQDALKALRNECRDKYQRGACSAYKIRVYGYDQDLDYISGMMDVTTDNILNLSYMMFQVLPEYDENRCVKIGEKNYCIATEAASVGDGLNLSLGDSYSVAGTTEKEFILLMWLTNLDESQNDYDIGNFQAMITMQAGNGGEIKGSIASAIQINPGV